MFALSNIEQIDETADQNVKSHSDEHTSYNEWPSLF